MKKRLFKTLALFLAVMLWQGCTKPEETGSIYGTVTDFDTGEPVKNANVKLLPSGETTLTGSDGTYLFQDLKKGDYSLSLSKAEYEDLKDTYVIQLEAGRSVPRDVQMKKKVALMRITDMEGNDISELDFNDEGDDVSRIFNIFNDSGVTLSYEITTTANWIQKPVDGASGTIQAGETKGIVVMIDRSKLQQGDNITTLHITSNKGNQQLSIKAKRVDVTTLEATGINGGSAVLNGKINTNIQYSEKGFYYGINHNLNTKVVVNGNGSGAYSTQLTGLNMGADYYYKAYCIYNGVYLYGEEKQIPLEQVPSFVYNGYTYLVAPDPGYDINHIDALSYCEGLTLYGFSDWEMPDKSQMLVMYANEEAIGGWPSIWYDAVFHHYYAYWTKTKSIEDEDEYYCIYIDNCEVINVEYFRREFFYGTNDTHLRVRPIRKAD